MTVNQDTSQSAQVLIPMYTYMSYVFCLGFIYFYIEDLRIFIIYLFTSSIVYSPQGLAALKKLIPI